jgi:ribA/ribD-fused uncharacterized protein
MHEYHFFWGGPFSNWCPAKFIYKGYEFANSEQAFMWEKAMCFNDLETADKILKEPNPREAKNLGRTVKGYVDTKWDSVRFKFMVDICLQKFAQNDDLLKVLLANNNFVEASPEDTIWGIGMREGDVGIEDPKNWKGTNLLGEALNQVRKMLAPDEN